MTYEIQAEGKKDEKTKDNFPQRNWLNQQGELKMLMMGKSLLDAPELAEIDFLVLREELIQCYPY